MSWEKIISQNLKGSFILYEDRDSVNELQASISSRLKSHSKTLYRWLKRQDKEERYKKYTFLGEEEIFNHRNLIHSVLIHKE